MEEAEPEEESTAEISALFEDNDVSMEDDNSLDTSVFEEDNKGEEKNSTGSDESSVTAVASNSFESKTDEIISLVRKHPLDDLSLEAVIKEVTDMQEEANHLNTENDMFERYLSINDPSAIEGMAATLENAIKMQGAEIVRRATLAENFSFTSDTKMGCPVMVHSSIMDRGYRALQFMFRAQTENSENVSDTGKKENV